MDGTHNLCTKMSKRDVEPMWSYKLKDIAYNILVNYYLLYIDNYSCWVYQLVGEHGLVLQLEHQEQMILD